MTWLERVTVLEGWLLNELRSPAADRVALDTAAGQLDDLRGRKYCILVTYRRDRRPVPTPVWFGLDGDKLYAHIGGAKVKRLARNSDVRVAPATFRGRPLGPPLQGTARALRSDSECAAAERAIQRNYGPSRRLYYRVLTQRGLGVYIEVDLSKATSKGLS